MGDFIKKKLFTKPGFLGLKTLLLVAVAALMLVANQKWTFMLEVRSAAATLVYPIQYTLSLPVRFIDWVGTNVSSQQQLLSENTKLKAEVLLLQAKMQKMSALERENISLRGLVSSEDAKGKSKKFLVARLFSVVASNVEQQIVLDKGSADGVYVGQPVIDAYGVMGQVILVAEHTCRVMLLTDAKSAIPVQNSRNDIRSIAVGLGYSNRLELIHVTETMDIKKDDILVSSGFGGIFPQGYPVGVVSKVEQIPGAKFVRVLVKPNAHVNRSRQVLLISRDRSRPVHR